MAPPVTDFGQFYEQNIEPLTRALTASLGDPVVAQDAAQEAMVKACEQWTKISTYDNPTGWCYRVARNWSTSRWRKRRREVLDLTDGRPAPTTHGLVGESTMLDDALVEAMLRLPLEQREVVVLRLLQDWSIAETAAALDIAEGTVQSRYSRAMARLREQLEHAYD